MKALSEAIALIAGEVHPEAVEKLCAALATNPNEEPFGLIKSHLGSAFSPLKLERLRAALNKCPGTTTAEISAMFQGSAKTAELLNQMRSIEMVWTGPSTNFVPIRHTEQVLTGLIDEAEESIFLVSFVAYNVVSVVAALQRAISRRVIVRFLLERSKQHGGSVNFDSIEILRRGLPQALYFEWDKEATVLCKARQFTPNARWLTAK